MLTAHAYAGYFSCPRKTFLSGNGPLDPTSISEYLSKGDIFSFGKVRVMSGKRAVGLVSGRMVDGWWVDGKLQIECEWNSFFFFSQLNEHRNCINISSII